MACNNLVKIIAKSNKNIAIKNNKIITSVYNEKPEKEKNTLTFGTTQLLCVKLPEKKASIRRITTKPNFVFDEHITQSRIFQKQSYSRTVSKKIKRKLSIASSRRYGTTTSNSSVSTSFKSRNYKRLNRTRQPTHIDRMMMRNHSMQQQPASNKAKPMASNCAIYARNQNDVSRAERPPNVTQQNSSIAKDLMPVNFELKSRISVAPEKWPKLIFDKKKDPFYGWRHPPDPEVFAARLNACSITNLDVKKKQRQVEDFSNKRRQMNQLSSEDRTWPLVYPLKMAQAQKKSDQEKTKRLKQTPSYKLPPTRRISSRSIPRKPVPPGIASMPRKASMPLPESSNEAAEKISFNITAVNKNFVATGKNRDYFQRKTDPLFGWNHPPSPELLEKNKEGSHLQNTDKEFLERQHELKIAAKKKEFAHLGRGIFVEEKRNEMQRGKYVKTTMNQPKSKPDTTASTSTTSARKKSRIVTSVRPNKNIRNSYKTWLF